MRLLPVLLCLSLLASCAAPAAETAPPSDVPAGMEGADYCAQAVLAGQPDGADYSQLSAEDGAFYLTEVYGISLPEGDDGDFGYAVYTVGGVDAREVAVVRGLGAGEKHRAAAAGMEAYRRSRVGDFAGYVPDQAALAEKGVVLWGDMAVLLLCTDPDAAREALAQADPALRLEPYAPSETEDPAENLDENGRRVFDPPNKFDMTPYDTSAILTAWETVDNSGLSDRDAIILDKCREALALCVTEDMTDFQKELNLHDWLVQSYYGCYDRTTLDPATPQGREDNQNPYGLLIRGYGVCLAYASTFQLLMDLAGVECITVIGASSDSGSDHAWNMVKLEGEWYCVDPTWNATYKEGLTQEAMWSWQHRYFNVTSQYMRNTDHQWDYETVPEATARRFRWDGTGALPQ